MGPAKTPARLDRRGRRRRVGEPLRAARRGPGRLRRCASPARSRRAGRRRDARGPGSTRCSGGAARGGARARRGRRAKSACSRASNQETWLTPPAPCPRRARRGPARPSLSRRAQLMRRGSVGVRVLLRGPGLERVEGAGGPARGSTSLACRTPRASPSGRRATPRPLGGITTCWSQLRSLPTDCRSAISREPGWRSAVSSCAGPPVIDRRAYTSSSSPSVSVSSKLSAR